MNKSQNQKIKDGIVLMIDVLGVSSYNIEDCVKFLENRKKLMNTLRNEKIIFGEHSSHYKDLHIAILGDTIILCWPIDDKKISWKSGVVYDVVAEACYIMQWGLENGMLFRGCIAVGKYIAEKDTVLGPAIFDAHDWYDVANWFGIIFSPKSQLWLESIFEEEKSKNAVAESLEKEFFKMLVRYDVPLVHVSNIPNPKEFWVIAWPCLYYSHIKRGERSMPVIQEKPKETPREILLKQLFNISETKNAEPKFKNSIDFFDRYGKKFFRPYTESSIIEKNCKVLSE
jgi:hypothetical protein